ncbi:putative DHNTP pyrophosphatase [Lachnospiraceae bacterium TWA4]|nr:putative DHNTP pyrophosphatase [Lachnospiraceae bacterium TWA4]
MERVDKILQHPVFIKELAHIGELEKERRYCRHSIIHLLDVARISYIYNLEENGGLPKDIIYGTALLHDIGKGIQYEDGTPHNISSADLAKGILADCGYNEDESQMMLEAIYLHRKFVETDNYLARILYRADKKSRACYSCEVCEECHWDETKKNLSLDY